MSCPTIAFCTVCGSRVVSHCRPTGAHDAPDHPTCDWWRCTSCLSYGDATRTVKDTRRRAVEG